MSDYQLLFMIMLFMAIFFMGLAMYWENKYAKLRRAIIIEAPSVATYLVAYKHMS